MKRILTILFPAVSATAIAKQAKEGAPVRKLIAGSNSLSGGYYEQGSDPKVAVATRFHSAGHIDSKNAVPFIAIIHFIHPVADGRSVIDKMI